MPAAIAEVARLAGQDVAETPDGGYVIRDVAGEGPPRTGVVERRGDDLYLVGDGGALRLEGPLAHPRIAGPGHKVWVIGEVTAGGALHARRLGVLAVTGVPPAR